MASAFFIFLDRSGRSVSLLQGKHDETNEGMPHDRQANFDGDLDGDLVESIKRRASDRLGNLVQQVRARTSPGVFRDMALLGLCLELSFSVLYCQPSYSQANLSSFLSVFCRGRRWSGNQPEPNGWNLLRKPQKSQQAVRSKKNSALEVNIIMNAPSSTKFLGSTSGAYLQGEVRARASQIPKTSHIWRTEMELSELCLPEALSERLPAIVQGKMGGREMAYCTYFASEDGGFCVPYDLFHGSRFKMLGSWSRSLWPTGQEIQQPWRDTLSEKRTEC